MSVLDSHIIGDGELEKTINESIDGWNKLLNNSMTNQEKMAFASGYITALTTLPYIPETELKNFKKTILDDTLMSDKFNSEYYAWIDEVRARKNNI